MFDNQGPQFPQKILQASSLSAACRGKLSEVWITVVSCQCTDWQETTVIEDLQLLKAGRVSKVIIS